MRGQKSFSDAEQLLLREYAGMKQREEKILQENKFRLVDALERLVQLYEAWNRPSEAAKWLKEREAHEAAKKSAIRKKE